MKPLRRKKNKYKEEPINKLIDILIDYMSIFAIYAYYCIKHMNLPKEECISLAFNRPYVIEEHYLSKYAYNE